MSCVVYNIMSCLPIVCRYKIKTLLQRKILIYLSHFISKLVSNVMLNVPLKLCTSVRVLHLAMFIFSAQSDAEVAARTRECQDAVVY